MFFPEMSKRVFIAVGTIATSSKQKKAEESSIVTKGENESDFKRSKE